ncbi:MAG: tRNA pseudouridine(55) synthase TruB [Novosphingobium sp.]|nr:tRNA pseudouridine(55) synthase TruB [Novosphingobium sp.]
MTAPHGWLILDKPVGLGSTQAVAAVKRNLRQAGHGKVKVGHGGTLDPLASGVLPIALGEATKLCGRMLDSDKTYEFAVAFGAETDTLDLEGRIVAESEVRPTLAEIEAVLPSFTGAIEQAPPAFSALMVGGQRAYDRARAGEEVELAARRVTIHSLSLAFPSPQGGEDSAAWPQRGPAKLGEGVPRPEGRTPSPTSPSEQARKAAYPLPAGEREDAVTLLAHVSKGTYIRSLARDVARTLGTVGHVVHLRRTRAGPFGLERAISLDKLNAIGQGAALENVLLPLEAGLDGIPALDLGPEQARAVRQGRVVTGLAFQDGVCWARSGGMPLALMQVEGGDARVMRGFNLPDAAE